MDLGLDIHILVHPVTPDDWVVNAIQSVKNAMANTKYQTSLHILDADVTSIGKGRMLGYAHGRQPFVTSVDDDDWVDEDAFAILKDAMLEKPAGIVTDSVIEPTGELAHRREALRVFRRDVAMSSRLEEWPIFDSLAILRHARTVGEVIEIPNAVYHQRRGFKSNNMKLMETTLQGMKDRVTELVRSEFSEAEVV